MLLALVQLFLIVSLIVFAAMPVVFVVLVSRRNGRGVLVAGSFVLGALAAGFVAWQLVPAQWHLPFWATLQATVDSETYGHAVEHYAEGVVTMMTCAAAIGGIACAGAVALGTKLRRQLARGS